MHDLGRNTGGFTVYSIAEDKQGGCLREYGFVAWTKEAKLAQRLDALKGGDPGLYPDQFTLIGGVEVFDTVAADNPGAVLGGIARTGPAQKG